MDYGEFIAGKHIRALKNGFDVDDGDITAVLDELDAMHEGQKRLTAIYEERGRTIAAMRQLMDVTH